MPENNDYSYLLDIIKLAEASEEKNENEKLNIIHDGEFFQNNNVSRVNLSLSYILQKDSSYDISINTRENNEYSKQQNIVQNLNKPLSRIDHVLSHNTLPVFQMPEKGHWVIMQNWDYGSIPLSWIESITDYVDQLWVSSNYTKKCFMNAKIPQEKIKVINNGVDSLYFNYHVSPTQINTTKKKKFLFRGKLNWQTGFDLLLKAYTNEFVKDEDVCLVVMSHAGDVSLEYNRMIKELTDLPDSPEILLIDEPDNQSNIPSIYKSCDFIVYPYRAESYCLNLIESMACGTPAIVTDYGASIDYCNSDNSILVKSSRIYQEEKRIENMETVSYPSWSEIDMMDLRVKLRQAFELESKKYDEFAQYASKSILDKFTWIKLNDRIKENLSELKGSQIQRNKQQRLNKKILEGLNALINGSIDKSLSAFDEAYKIDDKNANLNFYLSTLMMEKNELEKSLEHLKTSIVNNPEHEDYNNLAGIVFYKLGNFHMAKKMFVRTLYLMPEHAGAKESLRIINTLNDEQFNSIGHQINNELFSFFKNLPEVIEKKLNQSLSVCILTRNEQKNIEKAIKSVKTIADEIIILDTGSTDSTLELVKNLGVKVFSTIWEHDFSKARNELISHATMDWVLMLDADECLSEESQKHIKPLLNTLNKNKVYLPKIVNFIDKNNIKEKQEHYVVRLIPNKQSIKYVREIHEYPVKEDNSYIESEQLNEVEILHYGYTNQFMKDKNKIERNRAILEKIFNNYPDDPLNNFYLAENYKDQNNFQQVLNFSEKVVKYANPEEYENIIEMSKLNILDSLLNINDKNAENKFNLYKEDLSFRPDFWFLFGSMEYNKGNYDKAIEYNKKALELRSVDISSTLDLGTIGWKPMILIANSYKNKGDNLNSLIFLKRAIKEYPDNIELYNQLAYLYADMKELEMMEYTLKTFIGYMDNKALCSLIDNLKPLYFEKESEDRLYKLLESIRINRLKGNLSISLKSLTQKLIEVYNEISDKNYDEYSVKYSLAACYGFMGDLDNSQKLFEELIDSDKLDVDSLHNIGSIAVNRNELEKAELFYKRVLEIDEFHTQTYISLAKLEVLKKDFEKARDYLRELGEIDPDNQEISLIEFEIANASGDKKLASDMYAAMLFRNQF